jgi:hypothetical protein
MVGEVSNEAIDETYSKKNQKPHKKMKFSNSSSRGDLANYLHIVDCVQVII